MTKNERTPDIDAEEIIEMFRPEMRKLKPEDVGLESVPGTQRVRANRLCKLQRRSRRTRP